MIYVKFYDIIKLPKLKDITKRSSKESFLFG